MWRQKQPRLVVRVTAKGLIIMENNFSNQKDKQNKVLFDVANEQSNLPELGEGEFVYQPSAGGEMLSAEYIEGETMPAASLQATVENPFAAKPKSMIRLDEYRKMLAGCLITSTTCVPPYRPVVTVEGHGIFTKSDVHLVKAKAKSGKTTLMKIITAAIISGDFFGIKSSLSNPKVVYFDTEQSMNDTQRIIRDVAKMARISLAEVDRHVKVYHMRRLYSEELKASLLTVLIDESPDVIIIDGAVDMVESFNDEREAKSFIRALICLSETYDCAIINILHTNKAREDHNPRGHLGTNATNAAETVLECEHNEGVFTVKCTESRHGEMPEWHFMYDEEGNIVDGNERLRQIQERQQADKEAKKAEKNAKLVGQMLELIRANGGRMKKSDLVAAMINSLSLGKTTCYNNINAEIGRSIGVEGSMVVLL